jgi:hypothetical protein
MGGAVQQFLQLMQLKVGYFGASAAYNETLKDLV